ncbi:MAG: 30S ribosomal protein S12 methylthiotransferase RimO [Muribaculaceae bacterium]|nr:30S ribosomal protein S12 methylthiotransferase RimO [Bacteroidales bacterium]MDY4811592.1 30S ribosomal protein S12 methylthiotransferase RimO [Muribaculaceae bacterium]
MNKTGKISVNVVTLGCSKNLVDSERVLRMLSDAGFEAYHQTDEPTDIVVVNTCGFIGDAKEESVNTILEFAGAKERGELRELYVMGCLSERYRKELPAEIPEVDRWYGKYDWTGLVDDLRKSNHTERPYERTVTTPSHHAYVKISEGCNRFCAFCAIPLITGRHHSRPIEEIEQEVKSLVERGVREFNIIAQDLSSYGRDLYGKLSLAPLVERLAGIEGVDRIRLHYAYPAEFPYDTLPVMARHKNVCNYLDIALQHISDNMLTAMRRHITAEETRRLLAEIRKAVPGIHIRTTLMVGFPGETEEDFLQLMDFVREQRFERMGAFAYSEEEGTYAALNLPDNVPLEVKEDRLNRLMALQEDISMELQQEKTGKTFDVIIDSEEEDYYIGRTEYDSPEVDPEVLVKKTLPLQVGGIYPVKITRALPFELIGEALSDKDVYAK